jgi:hypothetical protein
MTQEYYTHRRSDNALYKRWHHMVHVTSNSHSTEWRLYGGRGIDLYKQWSHRGGSGFDAFRDWVLDNLGPIPYPNAIIRRIDSNKDFRPGNLEWSTKRIMSNHRQTNKMVRYQGRTQSIADWSRELGINYDALWSRLIDYKLKTKEAFDVNYTQRRNTKNVSTKTR